jgi:hypothetical protein
MVFHERVMDYSVSTLRNDVVDYRRILRLTTVSGNSAQTTTGLTGEPSEPATSAP